jgi:hypothetical protein
MRRFAAILALPGACAARALAATPGFVEDFAAGTGGFGLDRIAVLPAAVPSLGIAGAGTLGALLLAAGALGLGWRRYAGRPATAR